MHLKLINLPDDIIKYYNLADKVLTNGYIYVEIRCGMCGLPQAVLIAQKIQKKHPNKEGYHWRAHPWFLDP